LFSDEICGRLFAYFVYLLEQTLDTVAHAFPLFVQGGKLFLQARDLGSLLFQTPRQALSMLFDGNTKFALSLEQFNGAQHTFFKRLEFIVSHGHFWRVLCESGHLYLVNPKAGLRSQKV
jgi:hypothetical protein